jgi:NAD(P)-dependent dehydrogenase (short-subunit alcohol dehydrogenase family)
MREAIPHMRKNGEGKIINVSSRPECFQGRGRTLSRPAVEPSTG